IFGSWRPAPASMPPAPVPGKAAPIGRRDVVLVDKPGEAQSVIAATCEAPDHLGPLSPPDDVLNTLLGGSFTSRLNINLREEHGYTYGASSMFDPRAHGNTFVAMTSVATDV